MDMSLSKLRELVMDREAWTAEAHVVSKSWTRLSNWTEFLKNEILGLELWFEITPRYIKLRVKIDWI